MFGKRRNKKVGSSSGGRHFEESEYVGQVSHLASAITNATSETELYRMEQELNEVIRKALNSHTSNRDLITMEQQLANAKGISCLADDNGGGRDSLLQQRISILQNAFQYLHTSF